MKAAIVVEAGKTPVYGDFQEALPGDGELRVRVSASALSNLTKGRASGTHYSASARPPFVVGVDGVGRLDDGRRVYFAFPKAPLGGMAQWTLVPPSHCVPLPDGLDDVTAAAIANPGMSAWAALKERAHVLAGERVLINGATGSAGRLAVQIAKHLGAKKVVATGRNVEALKAVAALGADVTLALGDAGDAFEDALKREFGGEGVDVVLDYLWGPSAERILRAAAKAGKGAAPIRFVHIGAISAADITLPGAVLRSSAITLMGSGLGSVPLEALMGSIHAMLHASVPAGFKIATKAYPLSEVGRVWDAADSRERIVFQIP